MLLQTKIFSLQTGGLPSRSTCLFLRAGQSGPPRRSCAGRCCWEEGLSRVPGWPCEWGTAALPADRQQLHPLRSLFYFQLVKKRNGKVLRVGELVLYSKNFGGYLPNYTWLNPFPSNKFVSKLQKPWNRLLYICNSEQVLFSINSSSKKEPWSHTCGLFIRDTLFVSFV